MNKPRRKPYFLDNLRGALCMRCGYQWTPKVEYNHTAKEWVQDMPKKCPRCTSLHWDKPGDRRRWDKRFKRNFDDGG